MLPEEDPAVPVAVQFVPRAIADGRVDSVEGTSDSLAGDRVPDLSALLRRTHSRRSAERGGLAARARPRDWRRWRVPVALGALATIALVAVLTRPGVADPAAACEGGVAEIKLAAVANRYRRWRARRWQRAALRKLFGQKNREARAPPFGACPSRSTFVRPATHRTPEPLLLLDDDPCVHPRVGVPPLALKQRLLRAGDPPRDDHLAARSREQLA